MGRPSMGRGARSITVGVRVTEAEHRWLVEQGKPTSVLHSLLTQAIGADLGQADHPAVVRPRSMADVGAAALQGLEAGLAYDGPSVGEVLLDDASLLDQIAMPDGVDLDALAERDVPVHRHRRKTKIATEFNQGTKVEVWACECGAEMR